MAEPFKNQINAELIKTIGHHFSNHGSDFDREAFVQLACEGLEALELKERGMNIVRAMEATFPDDFAEAATIIEKSLHPEVNTEGFNNSATDERGLGGWSIIAIQEYVGRNGLQHLDIALNLLRELTLRLTSEFGIRYFLDTYPYETLQVMQKWVVDPNEHVRRLVSEGTRTRLPWGMQLKRFIIDPSPVIPFLEMLKDDPSEYVRRSVANNLNDLSKDHPAIVCKVARHWLKGADKNREKLVKHALRTLVKKGEPEALELLGFRPAEVKVEQFEMDFKGLELADSVKIGEKPGILLSLSSTSKKPQNLVIDYAVHFLKANGNQMPKVFKWTTKSVDSGESLSLRKTHSFVPVTTRKYYPGAHKIEALINGKSMAEVTFDLIY